MTDKHGTYAGWNEHRKLGTSVCDLCLAAYSGYQSGLRHRKSVTAKGYKHGTERGLILHKMLQEDPCPVCTAYKESYERSLAKGVAVPTPRDKKRYQTRRTSQGVEFVEVTED